MKPRPDDLGFGDDPVDNFEAAKRLIARFPNIDIASLIATPKTRTQPHSARLAAIWALGYVDTAGVSRAVLAGIADDPGESDDLRDHAVEALSSMVPAA